MNRPRTLRQRLSLRRRLLATLLIPLLALAAVGSALDYVTVQTLSGSADDRALASTAIGLAARVETDRDGDLVAHLDATLRAAGRLGGGARLRYLVLDGSGKLVAGEPALAALVVHEASANPAFADAMLDGETVRAVRYDYAGPDGRARIVVTEPLAVRAGAARPLVMLTLLGNAAMVLAVVAAALLAVRWALRPLGALGDRVATHDVDRLQPLPLRRVPAETRPLVRAINRLMARVRSTAQARQAFIAHTAHQLRNPLAGVQAQLALLAASELAPDARQRAADAQQAVQRLSHLTQQLLALARAADPLNVRLPTQPVALNELLSDVAAHCLDRALQRGSDLGFEAGGGSVPGVRWMLREMLVNLVDNAIVHTPPASSVTVRCGTEAGSGEAFFEVEDDGPGIAPGDRERVFDRFVRLADDQPGSGLGLAIVREAARRHGARVWIGDGAGGRGTRVRVSFPPA